MHTYDPERKLPTRRTELLITVIGIAGILLAIGLYNQVFSSAALDFRYSRQEIIQMARDELVSRGYDPEGYEFALLFRQAYYGGIYAERTLGVAETNRLLQDGQLPLYFWSARWFKPLQKEEFNLELSPRGEVIAFEHILPEDAPGADLPENEARQLAEAALQAAGWDVAQLKPLSSSSELRPGGRRDHTFTWERTNLKVGEGELRLVITVQGDRADGYDHYLKAPEAFLRQFDTQRNRANTVNGLFWLIMILGLGTPIWLAVIYAILRKNNPIRHAWRPALLVAGLSLLAVLNTLPLIKFNYITTEDYALFWGQVLVALPVMFLGMFSLVAILWSGGQQFSKLVWPRQDRILPRGPNRWVEIARSTWRGLMVGGWMAGYLVIFYLVAHKVLGWWSPLQAESINLYATPFPFLSALEVGVSAGTWEELLFRLGGISLMLWITRGRFKWLALLVPGVIWATLHIGYISDPIYVRVVELSIAAVFIEGLFFLRFGLLTTIVAHAAYNAGLSAFPMLASGEPYFVFNGVLVLLLLAAPMLPGAVVVLRRKLRGENTPSAPEIGAAAREDLPALQALPLPGGDWAALLDDENAVVMCARQAGQVVGAAAGVCLGNADGAVTGEIRAVAVLPAWRNQYLASRLVEEVSEQLKSRGAAAIQVTLPVKDRRSLSFFAHLYWPLVTQTLVQKTPPTFRQALQAQWQEMREDWEAYRRKE